MEVLFEQVKKKIIKEIELEEIDIINNSEKHKKHKFFDKNKYHLKLQIKSKYLSSLPRIEAQKKIMHTLRDELKNSIHALEIQIK